MSKLSDLYSSKGVSTGDKEVMTPIELNKFLCQNSKIQKVYDALVISLRRKQLHGGHACAKATIEVIRHVLGQYKFSSSAHMSKVVRAMGHSLMGAAPTELIIGNVIRRTLNIIREEHNNSVSNTAQLSSQPIGITAQNLSLARTGSNLERILSGDNLFSVGLDDAVDATGSSAPAGNTFLYDMRPNVLLAINEFIDEIDSVFGPISEQANENIHNGECILTTGGSNINGIIEIFLKSAAKTRKFQVIIAENEPSLDGHQLAATLSKQCPNVSVTLIPDSGIYAIMCRVNKVLLSPLALMADGGAICPSGHIMIATAANAFSVPVMLLSPTYMLTPLFAHTQDQLLIQLRTPSEILPFNAKADLETVQVIVPSFDYLSPQCITLILTNNGSHQPSYMYRLVSEYYHPSDFVF